MLKIFKVHSDLSVLSTTKRFFSHRQPLQNYLRISQKLVLFLHGVYAMPPPHLTRIPNTPNPPNTLLTLIGCIKNGDHTIASWKL